MRKKNFIVLFFLVIALTIGFAETTDKIQLQIQKIQELGKKEMMFASIASVCEDSVANLYVLDRMEHKVLKFSQDGELIQTFGQKGQGPGDYQNPHLLAFTPKGQIVVADELYNLTFLNEEGDFIKRTHLDGRLAVSFIGEDRFYGWIWGENHRSQVMVDGANKVLKNFFQVPFSAFSVSAPDESGRQVMFNYSREEFAPSLQFAHFGRYSAVGIGDRYDILILDENGETISHIRREILPDNFSKREKRYFEKDIGELGKERGWPRSIVRDIVKKIPDKKIYFSQILLTEKHVFVFRTKNDITEESGPIPVDIFLIKGEFLGTTHLPYMPLHISHSHIYFIRSDEEDNLYLEKATYKVLNNKSLD
ncbi:MAG: 6-bladed beta-propeller [Candidatus Aminicenantes bacterium]|nr:MAG: 6-bladed beta-propeller [Candidatus Aminicenantes bacterium]